MRKELPFTSIISRFLQTGFYRFSTIQDRLIQRSIRKRIVIPLFLFFISISAHAQLALQTFESGIPSSWPSFTNTVGTQTWGISSDSYRGTSAAFLNPSAENIGAGNTAQYFLATPVQIPQNGEIRFYSKQATSANNGAIYQIRLSTAGLNDPSGYSVILKSWTEADLNIGSQTAYEEKIVAIPSNIPVGLNVNIAFVVVNTQTGATPSGDAWFLDNIRVIESCQKVIQTNFSASNITSSGANLAWTHPTAFDFQIQVVTQGTAPGATGTNVQNSYPAGSLLADTAYDVYIKTVCDADTASEWAGPFPFRTKKVGLSCDSPIVIPVTSTPYILSSNLNLFADNPTSYTTQGSGCLPAGVTGNYLNGAKAFFSYTPTQNGLLSIKQMTLPSSPGSGCFGNAITGVFVYDSCSTVGVSCMAGLNTTATSTPKYISNLYVQAGHTYIIVISSTSPASTSICFNFELSFSSCGAPSVFTYKNLLQDSVVFSWDNVANLASSWEYVVRPANAGVPTGPGTATNSNIDNLITSGLAAGQSYDLYVRSVCGGTPGEWGIPYRFTTQCAVFNTPYSTAFPGTSATVSEPCWTAIDVNRDGQRWSYLGGYATMQTSTFQNNNNDMFVSPQVNFNGTQKRLRYKHQVTGGVASYGIKISTTGVGADNFTTILLPDTQITNTAWQEKIINIPANITGNVNIAWVIVPGSGHTATRISIDDVFIEDKPACPDPLALAANGITTSQAQLSWTAGDVETQWQVVVQPKDTGIPTGSGVLVNSAQYTADQLTHATQYEYYVRAYCSSTQQSNWVGPFYFTTVCGVFDTPFNENFDTADVNNHRSCWTITDANTDGTTWRLDPTFAAIQGRTFPFPTASYNDWLISPAINVVGTKTLKFKYKAALSPMFPNPRFGIEVLISTTDRNPASFSVIMPLMEFTNTDFIEKSLYINATGPVYIAFRVPPSFSTAGGTSILQIDDVKVEDAPACPAPSELRAASITQTSGVLSWTKGYQETQWQVVVQEVGSGIPTGNGQLTSNNTTFATGPLLPNRQYEYYVRAYCSTSEQSQWVGPFRFTTLCNAFTTPFVETFNPGSVSEECWRVVNGNSDTFSWNLHNTLNPYEGEHAAMIFTGSNGNNDDWLISPTITVRPGQRLRYYYRVLWGDDFKEDLEVKLSTSGSELNQFSTMLYEVSYESVPPLNNPEWKEKVINLPAGVTGDINIAWHIPQKAPNPWNYRGQLLVIDKVVIEDIPACAVPNNLAVSDIIDTGAKISWDANGTETSWDVYVQPAELPAPVGDGDAQYLHNTSSNPYTVTGLTPAVKYEYYVRAVCSATQDSEWVGPFEFTTRCSFENLCEYTITLSGGTSSGVGGGINLVQNGVIIQSMVFPSGPFGQVPPPVDFTVFLCTGVEFSLVNDAGNEWQFTTARVEIKDASGNQVWIGGIGLSNSRIYTGVATCGPVTCPQPTNLAVNSTGVLSWTAGGSETQWEVFIQPLENNTLPQSGTLVTTASYTPQASDFADLKAGTYEFFVRAVCSSNDKSYWSGPRKFVRNDDASKAVVIPVNAGTDCEQSATKASFIGATASTEAMACTGVNNGDIWFEFVASSKVHVLELGNFSAKGSYQGGYTPDVVAPSITLTLYKVNGSSLQQLACTYNNAIVMSYMAEVEPGATYKVRMTLNDTAPNICTFDVCITTPQNLCALDIVNGSFERPEADFGLGNFYPQNIIPGWRTNAIVDPTSSLYNEFFFGNATGIDGYMPYDGGQVVQTLSPDPAPTTLDNVKGIYQDLDSSEITQFKYGYAHATRGGNSSLELLAGPPAGPFVLLEQHPGSLRWNYYEGTYNVPAGQTVTRFVFRSKDNAGGNLLDAVSITANVDIKTAPLTLACQETSALLEAEGVGTWVADENNPAQVIIASPNNKSTAISGFNTPGAYTFHWKTRYCDKTVVVTYNGFSDVPTVTSPVEYCLNATAQPLAATPTVNYTLKWFTQETGGTGTTTAPTPETTAVGSTTYYVSNVDVNGCEGPRVAITVTVNQRTTAEVGFSYDDGNYCIFGSNPVITKNPGFATGGTFEATPNGLGINTTTGEIDLGTSTAGTYTVKYSIGNVGCTDGGINTVSITIDPAVAAQVNFTYETPVCSNNANLLPQLPSGFTTGGEFSSGTLTVNTLTGEIDMATATVGLHTITYNVNSDAAACRNAGSQTFQIQIEQNIVPVTGFTYQTSYCKAGTNPLPTLAQDFYTGGAFETTGGLIINATTGEIDLANSPAGVYTITYKVVQSGCNSGGIHTENVTINAVVTPQVTFSYANVCTNSGTNPLPILPTGFSSGGTFSSSTITVNPTTGEINLAGATAGTHQIKYTLVRDLATCTDEGEFIAEIVLESGVTPVTGFTYQASYCKAGANPLPTLAQDFYIGGAFEATGGLVINATTGEIDLANSPAGNYTITYKVVQSGCNSGGIHTENITINALTTPQLTFSYNNTCINASTNPRPILSTGFTQGGSFTSSTITVNPTTGEINLAGATQGTHQIVYTLAQNIATCTDGGSNTVSITINAGVTPTVGFTYDTPVCQNDANLLPNLAAGFTAGGRFSAPTGVAINTATGEISVSQSTPGTYQITYVIEENIATCSLGGNGSFTVTISEGLQVSIAKECSNQTLWLKATPSDAASYEWKDGSGATVGNQADLNVEEYLSQHPGATMPITFTVTAGSGACSTTASFTVESSSCKLIPKGISPNGDSLNDSFDLSGMGVQHLSIFNRYGTEVYKFKGSYTNEWHGQDRDGKDLPDATYFYSISKQDGTTVTGWVYINRQY
ncbi:choice-of-anchor J domain-containing protein [Flavobacterium microcysteis]|uniref:T9SS type B sorting domain-containing protein n=1 Tax=Flavobacterium microcysteis TaxID=2596891 RepID=A0A501Q9V4_9FLAO|nr:choice-of-anchor J domain-containing protein [Flavobacterium microcysteis]TPD69689.1 T9SS type B sorting domain-containing protein [Flavobacterium microcysteis]